MNMVADRFAKLEEENAALRKKVDYLLPGEVPDQATQKRKREKNQELNKKNGEGAEGN